MSEIRTPASPQVPRPPICAQCQGPMVLERLEPTQSETTHSAVYRCEVCHLVELVEEVKLPTSR